MKAATKSGAQRGPTGGMPRAISCAAATASQLGEAAVKGCTACTAAAAAAASDGLRSGSGVGAVWERCGSGVATAWEHTGKWQGRGGLETGQEEYFLACGRQGSSRCRCKGTGTAQKV
eukprot:366388-Chlamydomonas_euryale.AAC.1